MRILYFVHWELGEADGVTRKILGQQKAWQRHGHQVFLCAVSRTYVACDPPITRFEPNGVVRDRFVLRRRLARYIRLIQPDIVYTRTGLHHQTLHRIGRLMPVVREVNTDERAERAQVFRSRPTLGNLARLIEAALLSPIAVRRSAGVVTVTHEIAQRLPRGGWRRCIAVVPNGIDLSAHNERRLRPAVPASRPSLFFLGSPGMPWHGVDVLLRLAARTPEFDYHLVGPEGTSKGNVRFYGKLPVEKYLPIMDGCDVCVGSLALFRNNMEEACPLKVREYLARGFPTVIGFRDTAFKNDHNDEPIQVNPGNGVGLRDDGEGNGFRSNAAPRRHQKRPWLLELDGKRLAAGDRQQEEAFVAFVKKSRGVVVDRSDLAAIDSKTTEGKRLAFFERVATRT